MTDGSRLSPSGTRKLTVDLKKYALNEGADLFGVASADKLNHMAPSGHRPCDFLPKAKSVVVMAVHLIDGVINRLPQSWREFNCNYFESTDIVNVLGFRVASFLEKHGHGAYPISYGSRYGIQSEGISDRHTAVEAGLGGVGLNNLLITPQYGPRIRLMVALTEAKLVFDKRYDEKICGGKKCGYKCVHSCPANALDVDGKIDYQKCWDHNKSLPVLMTGDHARCGMCIAACPIPKYSIKT